METTTQTAETAVTPPYPGAVQDELAWLPVVGYEGFYEVSNTGSVRSLDRTIPHVLKGVPHKRTMPGRVLRMTLTKDGYPSVTLSREGKTSTRLVHHLVASAFIGAAPGVIGASAGQWQIDHIDGDKTNNRPANLVWLTKEQHEVVTTSRGQKASGAAHGMYKGSQEVYPGATVDELAWSLVKYLAETAQLRSDDAVYHEKAWAEWETFVSDIALFMPDGRRVCFEIGSGRVADMTREDERDARLVASGLASAVYRVRGSDALYRMDDALYAVAQAEPSLFSERGRINLQTLASPEVKAKAAALAESGSETVHYSTEGMTHEQQLHHAANRTEPTLFLRRCTPND